MANNESYINSSKYTYGEFEKKRIEDRNDAILKIGAAGAGITAAYYLLEAQQVQTAASKLFKLDILKDYIQFIKIAMKNICQKIHHITKLPLKVH